MTIDAETAAHRIVSFLSDQEVIMPYNAMHALLLASIASIMVFAKDRPQELAAVFAETLLDQVELQARDFPGHLKAGALQ